MKKLLLTILLAVSMLSVTCRFSADPQTTHDTVQTVPVTLDIPQETGDGASTYRVTITGADIDTIGPLHFATTQPVTINVPAGNDIHIFCAMYNGNGILVEAGTITADITDGTRQISIPLAKENQPPLITRQPVSITASAAKEVTFSVAASGKELKFQWQRGTSEITGATDSVYKTSLATTENGTTFRCIVSNVTGSDTSDYAMFLIEGSSRDTIPPVITISESVYYLEIGGTFVDPVITCIDNGYITIPQSCVVTSGKVNTSVAGTYLLIYTVADAAGNTATAKLTVIVTLTHSDPTPPEIILNLSDSIVRIELPATGNAVWKEPGYSAVDALDGDITSKVVVDSSGLVANLSMLGNYVVTYSVTNSSGLTAKRTRKIQIYEQIICYTPPVIKLKGKNPDTVLYKSVTEYADPGCTAMDNRDGDITTKVTRSGKVDVTTLGKYQLTYSVTDSFGNRAYVTRVVWVVRDTASNDLLISYAVPTNSALPTLKNKTYTRLMVDGEGPDLSTIKKMTISWDAENSFLYLFQITSENAPYVKDFASAVQNFKAAKPSVTLKNSQIPGLDGTYYVAVQGTEFYWVESTGKFAIVWQE